MSKNTSAKKSKRKLKRSVRKSLAAVLMITAIGVAAVPVPENYAEDGTTGSGTTITGGGKEDKHSMFEYDSQGQEIPQLDKSLKLDKYIGDDSLDSMIADLKAGTGNIYAALNINDLGNGKWDLGWQFLFYTQENTTSKETQGVICKYNSQYRAQKVELNVTPYTEYYIVEKNKFDAYFDVNYTDTSAENMTHEKAVKGMSADPTVELNYTYSDWLDKTEDSVKDVKEAVDFLTKYEKDLYDNKIKEFQNYKQALENYKQALTNHRNDPDRYPEPVEPEKPSDITITPSLILETEERLGYYCDHDKELTPDGNSGYTLQAVIDSRITTEKENGGNSSYVYVARGGKPTEDYYTNDANGFLVTSQGVKVCAIGNRAFAGIGNVDVLTLPEQIGYIGDEAFEGSFIKEIEIASVKQLGNRAFQKCTQLSKATIQSGTNIIGAECFEGSALSSITLPYTVTEIGYGAFANCRNMTTLNLDNITSPCEVKDAAFYNCTALTNVSMSKSMITHLGEGAFAVESGASPLSIVMPSNMSEKDSIGDYMFAGRSALESVVFPKDYGRTATTAKKLPDNMFHGCTGLSYVEFPVDIKVDPTACGYVSYSPDKLFSDVTNTEFYVRGPEKNAAADIAKPRSSTWEAFTWVNDFVPYVFKNSAGVDCYEVAMDGYRYQANNKGELTSCVLVGDTDGNLVIPSKVGNYPITSVVPGCFDDEKLRESIKTITIEDNSVTSIGNGVFKDLPKLQEVTIGNSVSAIGENAFAGCKVLEDVTFHTPSAGYDKFTIGKDAFKTGGEKLTFHGDIVEGYAPFEWAMDKDNLIDEVQGIRVCYKSLSPTYLTVMYDAETKLVTLLDYPKYNNITEILKEAHSQEITTGKYGSYEAMMEDRNYTIYRDSKYDSYRKAFAEAWQAASTNTTDPVAAKDAVYNSSDYGPWVNPEFCADWEKVLTTSGGTTGGSTGEGTDSGNSGTTDTEDKNDTALTGFADFLLKPLVVEAADDNPQAFYLKYPYDVMANIESNNIYRAPTEEERALVAATKNVVVPAGVDSIDVYGFFNGEGIEAAKNKNNARTYLGVDSIGRDAYEMYTNKNKTDKNTVTDITPGLFSGHYDDNAGEEQEQYTRGNDRVESITLNSVKYLPDYAFDSCERLQYVILGPDCEDIGTAPFRGCYSLTMVGDNDYYKTDNGIVYSVNTDGSYTIEECLPARGNLVGGAQLSLSTDANLEKVSAVREGAFEECKYINLVDFSDTAGLMDIPKDCFKNCSDLTRLSLPRSVNNIEEGAFVNDLKLVELTIPGTEVFISARAFEENPAKAWTTIRTYENSSARRYADTYKDKFKLTYEQKNDEWKVIFLDSDLQQVGEALYVEDNTYISEVPECPKKDNWTFEKWLGTNNVEVTDRITSDTTFVAQGYSDNGMVNGKYTVMFFDQVDGTQIGVTQYVEPGQAAIAPQAPVHNGYTFLKWSSEEYTNVQKNLTIMAMYSGGSAAGTPGGTPGGTNTSGGSTQTSGGTTNTSGRSTSTSASSTSNTTSGSSTSTTSTSAAAAGQFVVMVIDGSGSGSYAPGTNVIITANTPAAGKVFSKWVVETEGVTLASVSLPTTTFVMPSSNVTIRAEYTDGTAAANTAATPTAMNTSTNGNRQDGNTRVDITKPGISNKDLATANVNGSSDNFVVKISETDEASQAVAAALTNKYGSLENILYYAMDISLYDSTGTTKITDTTGLSVDITIPIPDALLAYGGNNMTGAVINYNPVENAQLEDLSEKFTTINGVPCVTFTATHFSPYTVYVDTGNLTEGMLDVTPKTGDPIHPKWFLSIGLACLSIILFIKKDKNTVKVKHA